MLKRLAINSLRATGMYIYIYMCVLSRGTYWIIQLWMSLRMVLMSTWENPPEVVESNLLPLVLLYSMSSNLTLSLHYSLQIVPVGMWYVVRIIIYYTFADWSSPIHSQIPRPEEFSHLPLGRQGEPPVRVRSDLPIWEFQEDQEAMFEWGGQWHSVGK